MAIVHRGAICVAAVLGLCPTSVPAAQWIVQDDIGDDEKIHRIEARAESLRRHDLYGVFEQRLVIGTAGKPPAIDERRVVAVNCYTGRWGDMFVGTFERAKDTKPKWKTKNSILDIDRSASLGTDIRTAKQHDELSANVWKFGCSCSRAIASKSWPTTDTQQVKQFYEEKVVPLPRSRDVLVGFIRADDRSTAQKAIDALKKGEDFSAVAEQYSTAKEFARGVIPWSAESQYAGRSRALLNSLKPNEFHPEPVEGVFGWEVWKLLEWRAAPLPTLEESRSSIEAYLGNEALCATSTK